MKKYLKTMSLLTILVLGLTTACLADSSKAKQKETIPATMPGGTIITYDRNCTMTVEQPEDVSINQSGSKSESIKKETVPSQIGTEELMILEEVERIRPSLPVFNIPDQELPQPQPGMKVYYDGMGLPNKVEINGAVQRSHTPPWYAANGTYNYSDCTLTITSSSVTGEGWITWFSGTTGSDGTTLDDDDCATKMAYDIPRPGTAVAVRKFGNPDITDTVYKYDIGGLPNAVLDVRRPEMENVFEVTCSTNPPSGRFDGRMWHRK